MKFFTREWHSGEMPEEEAARVCSEYAAHIETLRSSLPLDALLFVNKVSLHDGTVRNVVSTERELTLVLRCEDQAGEFDAYLRYGKHAVSAGDLEFLEQAVSHSGIVLLYNEFDRLKSVWVHRMLFWPYREVAVEFETFSFGLSELRA
jgi:hypothetical protein